MNHLKVFTREVCGACTLCADGPLLIRSGASTKNDPALPDAVFLTGADGGRTAYVIPGSSLKGVIRHYLEDNGILTANEAGSLFGTLADEAHRTLRGRLSLSDAYADMTTVRTIYRTNTAIVSVSQGVKTGSLNNTETLDRGKFRFSFRIVNFSGHDVFALLTALDAMHRHILFIGGRAGKGYGRVSVTDFSMRTVCGFKPDLTPDITAVYSDLKTALSDFGKEAEYAVDQ